MPHFEADRYSLVADVGGTNTRVALADGREVRADTVRRYRNAEYDGLEAVLRRYLVEEGGVDCAGVCVAVAGPVRDGVATLTNLDWTIHGDALGRETKAETVAILNDLQAQGHALGHIAEANLRRVVAGGNALAASAKLVIGVGTGFNAAPVHETDGGRLVAASECGHVAMPVRTEADLRLARHVEAEHGFAGVEEALSGRGVERLYAFAAVEAKSPCAASAAAIMAALGGDGAGEAPAEPKLARAAAEHFVRLLGCQVGDLALTHLPFGGVYLCGGVARAFTEHLAPMEFERHFRDKGRFSEFMENFGVWVIEDDFAALTGCASYLAARSRKGVISSEV